MKWLYAFVVSCFAAISLQAGDPPKPAPAKPKTTSKPAAAKPATKTTTTKSKTASVAHTTRGRSGKRTRNARSAPAPSYQLHPDPERYQEIQKALADKGYFKGEVNGHWSDDSVDALKRFQADQKLESDGKINALTLTGLGLGPKHDGSSVTRLPADATSMPAPVSETPPGTAAASGTRPPDQPK